MLRGKLDHTRYLQFCIDWLLEDTTVQYSSVTEPSRTSHSVLGTCLHSCLGFEIGTSTQTILGLLTGTLNVEHIVSTDIGKLLVNLST